MLSILINLRELKPGVKGMYFEPDIENGIKQPLIVINSKLDLKERGKTLRHELFHHATGLFLSTEEFKTKVVRITEPNLYIHELIAHIGAMYGASIENTAQHYEKIWKEQ